MEEKSMKHQSANYVLLDEFGLTDLISHPDSPIFSLNALKEYADRQRRREDPGSNKRLAWLEDSNGKVVVEATARATTILDDDFQKAIEDEELAIRQGEKKLTMAVQSQSISKSEQNKIWPELLREARLKLQADLDSIDTELNKFNYIEIEDLTISILGKNKEYVKADHDFEKWIDRAEDEDSGFVFRVFSQWMARRAEDRMLGLRKEILTAPSVRKEFKDAYRHNDDYLETSLKHTELSNHISQIRYYESKLAEGVFTEKEFKDIWDNRLRTRLNTWQEMVIRPQFDPKFNNDRRINPSLERPLISDLWLQGEPTMYGMPHLYGITPQASNEDHEDDELMKARP